MSAATISARSRVPSHRAQTGAGALVAFLVLAAVTLAIVAASAANGAAYDRRKVPAVEEPQPRPGRKL